MEIAIRRDVDDLAQQLAQSDVEIYGVPQETIDQAKTVNKQLLLDYFNRTVAKKAQPTNVQMVPE
jgi:predicted porin